jgi:hypothetical protein
MKTAKAEMENKNSIKANFRDCKFKEVRLNVKIDNYNNQ